LVVETLAAVCFDALRAALARISEPMIAVPPRAQVDDALVFADPNGRRSHPADDLCCASEQARLLYDGTQGWIQPKIASRSSMGASAPKPREGRPNRCDATWPVPKLTLNRAFHHMLP
jgi:hypothetical protein